MTFVAMFTLQAVTLFLLAGMNTELTLAVAASVVGFNFGGNFALCSRRPRPTCSAPAISAPTTAGCSPPTASPASSASSPATPRRWLTGSYAAAFSLAAVLCLISAGLALSLKYLPKRLARAT